MASAEEAITFSGEILSHDDALKILIPYLGTDALGAITALERAGVYLMRWVVE